MKTTFEAGKKNSHDHLQSGNHFQNCTNVHYEQMSEIGGYQRLVHVTHGVVRDGYYNTGDIYEQTFGPLSGLLLEGEPV